MNQPPPVLPLPPAPAAKRRLAVVGATYASEEPRKKIESLAEHFDLTCITSSTYTGYGLRNTLAEQPVPTTYRLVGLPAIGRPDSTTRYFFRGLGKALREARPEVVLVESEPWAWLRWQTWWCARRLPVKVRFGEFSWENARRTGWRGWLLSKVYHAAAATADFVIGGNVDAGTFFCEAGVPRERLLVAPQLGVDEKVFEPTNPTLKVQRRAALGLPADAYLVGFSGRLLEMKGVPDLVKAIRRVRDRPGGDKIELALLGPGDPDALLGESVTTRPDWLHVRPACSHAEMAHFMQALDFFVLPSREWNHGGLRWREQFGHVLIEAMACGVPVLGSSCGAIPAVLGNPAQIFPEGNTVRLAEMLYENYLAPSHRMATVQQQTRRLHENYTNTVLARRWARFLKEQAAPPVALDGRISGRTPRVCVLGDQRILHMGNRPRRFLEHFQAEAEGEVEVHCAFAAYDDEELQRKFAFLKTPRARAYLSYALTPWHTLRSYFALRRAGHIYCEGPHYFWMLVLLNRVGIFPVRGKKAVWCLFFPHSRFVKKLGLLNASPTGFRPFFITQEQIRLLEAKGAEPGRIRRLDWKVDADWFHPAASPTRDFILCPGNIHRDDRLIAALVGRLDLPLVRAGRMNYLRERFAPFAGRRDFRVEINLDHQGYRRLVQNAAVVILPIEPCDEPAGLTAALEALACRTPILANPSLGVGPLLERVGGPGILLPDLSPETWRAAVARTLASQAAGNSPLLDAGRLLVEQFHAIESEKQDWQDFVRQATL